MNPQNHSGRDLLPQVRERAGALGILVGKCGPVGGRAAAQPYRVCALRLRDRAGNVRKPTIHSFQLKHHFLSIDLATFRGQT